jgi:uncharacterized membrane protein YedE/YeeE
MPHETPSPFADRWVDLPVCGLTFAATAWVTGLTLRDGGMVRAGLFATSLALGWVFVRAEFGYTAGFRHLLRTGNGSPLAVGVIVAAVAALVVVPLAAIRPGYFGANVTVSLPLVLGAALFGLGMQLANGCGSGTLYGAGALSRRLLIALPCFCIGGVLGSLLLPPMLDLPDLGSLVLGDLLGPAWGLLATELAIAGFALALWRGRARPDPRHINAALVIGCLAALAFLLSGQTWGITAGLTLWGAKAVVLLGFDLTRTTYWSWDGNRQALAGPLLSHVSAMMDIGMLLGAMLAAAAHRTLRHRASIGVRGALGAVIGGLLMGIGARLSSGCNIGAFIGGLSSGSVHGLVWFLAALPGSWLGMRLRPWFGLDRPSSDQASTDQVIQRQDTRPA